MPAVIRIAAESSLATASVNVWHWIIPNSAPVTEAQNAVDALDTFYTAIAGELANGIVWTIGSRVVTVDQNPNLVIGVVTGSATGTGTNTNILSAAAVLNLGSNIVGGAHRGRVYLGPLDSAATNSNGRQIASSTQTAITAAAGTLMATTTGGIQLAVWSRKNLQATAVSSVSTRLTIGSQRRRLI